MNGLQQFQMESCQPVKRLEDKKKMELNSLKICPYSLPMNVKVLRFRDKFSVSKVSIICISFFQLHMSVRDIHDKEFTAEEFVVLFCVKYLLMSIKLRHFISRRPRQIMNPISESGINICKLLPSVQLANTQNDAWVIRNKRQC
jgi:hypothetical protein